jgi:hypothetical protein
VNFRVYAVVALLAVPLLAQDQNNQQKKDQPPDTTAPNQPATQPAPGPIQPATQPSPGAPGEPVVESPTSEPKVEPEYGGPAILSRGGTASLRTPSENIKIRPYASITGSYDSGITPVILNSSGAILNEGSWGLDAEVGLNGYHRWKSATLGLDYKGVYRDYTANHYLNGTDQTLNLIYQKQATRHLAFTLRESAGILNRSLFYYGPYNFVDPAFAQAPTQDVFDGRTIYLNTMADVTYRKSARLSFNFGGDGFLTRRRSSALYGVAGARARGDVAYRTSKNATTGVAYDFTHFDYTKGFGGSDIHTLTITQAFRFGRHWELGLKAGGSRVETLGLTQVAIDPVIAAIIGRSEGIQVIYRVNWVPSAHVLLTRSLHHGSIDFVYDRGVTPGNGLFLTSRTESAVGSFSYTGVRKLNVGFSAGHTSFGTLTVGLGNYSSYTAGAGYTYKITGPLSFTGRYDYRHYDVAQTIFKRDTYRVSLGFAFSPRDVPLTLW